MNDIYRIACLQTNPFPNFKDALDEAISLGNIAVAGGAKFIALPEYCGGLKTVGAAFSPPSEDETDHPVLNGLKDFSYKNDVYMLIGSIAITGIDDKIYNRSFILDNRGEIISRYDKIHLFDVNLSENEQYRESDFVTAGSSFSICNSPLGSFGQTICYDLRFPDIYRKLSQQGAEILLVPAVFTKKTGKAHWHVLNRSRAIENGAYVIAPCAVGKVEGGGEGYGHSLIINPWGEVLSDAETTRGVTFADVNLEDVKNTRKRIPSLKHDRQFNLFKENERVVA